MTQPVDWAAIAAPLLLVSAAVVALLVDTFAPRVSRRQPCVVALLGIGAAAVFTAALRDERRVTFCLPARFEEPVDCSWVVDDVTLMWWVVVLAATAAIALLLSPAVEAGDLPGGETYFLLLSSAAGAVSVAGAGDLVTLVVAMEMVSLPSFALVGLRRRDRRGAEAALKFFIVSVVSTAVTLLGISLVYGATGSVAAGAVATAVATGSAFTPLIGVGMVLTLVGLGFKVAVVPFQMWVPDTYVGAPIGVAAYLSVVSKVAGLAGVTIVVVRFLPTYVGTWSPMLAVAAALTMSVGNLAALRQRHAVRLLAWSSVAQAGFLLVPLAAGGAPSDVGAIQAYAAMYALVNVGAFSVVVAVSGRGAVEVSDFSGLARREPVLGLALAFALLCLAGLPPGVIGLLAKVVIFQTAVDAGMTWLAVVMAVNVAIGLVYYLRFLATLFVEPVVVRVEGPAAPDEPVIVPVGSSVGPVGSSGGP
ncbi:MAG: NADH-quinone oxidoreductase subunit N, partial [Propionibacteriales bacterium]|nr:NADH-quinone oxidoreductase subunit N [Propionibacteriales bacterium]